MINEEIPTIGALFVRTEFLPSYDGEEDPLGEDLLANQNMID